MGFREILDLTNISSEFKKLSMMLEMDKLKTKFCCSAPPSQTFHQAYSCHKRNKVSSKAA